MLRDQTYSVHFNIKIKAIGILFSFMLCNCNSTPEQPKLFTLLSSDQTNIHFSNHLMETGEFNILEYLYFYDGAGVAVGDINNDGFKDLFFTSNQSENKLYLNKGNFVFEDISSSSGIDTYTGWAIGAAMADVNGDGYLDIYVSQLGSYRGFVGHNLLFINDGGSGTTFSEKAKEYGLDHKGYSTQSSFFDYDNDGDLDMYLLNHSAHESKNFGPYTLRYEHDSLSGDKLFRNDTDSAGVKFTDVTQEAGIYDSFIGYGLGVTASDINNDGCIDIFISNDFHENDYLYINNCDGTFTETLEASMGHTSLASMGNDVADFNNDGLLDIMVLEMLPDKESVLKKSVVEDPEVNDIVMKFGYIGQLARNTLQLNLGNGLFSEIALIAGIEATDWSWAPLFCDLDNDGFKDLFVSNGIYKRPNDVDFMDYKYQYLLSSIQGKSKKEVDKFLSKKNAMNMMFIEKMPTDKIPNKVFKNNGDLTFREAVEEWGLDQPVFSNGSAYADLDNDGDLDLVMNNVNQEASIYRNNAEQVTTHNYLGVHLKGAGKNTSGIGAKVILKVKGNLYYQEQMPVRGFQSSVDHVLSFGVGTTEKIDTLTVIWPNFKSETLTNVPANQILEVRQNNATDDHQYLNRPSGDLIFEEVTQEMNVEYQHSENEFNDFDYQFLMPHKLSSQGPALAVGDVNGDGLEDFYIGGATNQAGCLFIQKNDETFFRSPLNLFDEDSIHEDVDAAFFDADGDKDLDLYVVSGGNESRRSTDYLKDRLYLNDGSGVFTKSVEMLPPNFFANGSCVAPADFDQDGDMDLFVGSRSAVNNYGYNPKNYLLVNTGKGKFEDATRSVAPELPSGMVTDALWTDIDNDRDVDLVLVGDWMPVMIFRNEGHKLQDISTPAGLEKTNGWWNCVESMDMDGDGDQDLMVGNLGLNSKIKASPQAPVTLYVADFDANGKLDQILCQTKNGKHMPFAMRDELLKQIPGIKGRIPSYQAYAEISDIGDIFDKSQLEKAVVKKAYILSSVYIENLGNGSFETHLLPLEAQFSPVFSVLTGDFDHDGLIDALLAGNFSGASINYGLYDASYGILLKGDGKGSFKTFPNRESGLSVKGEVRSMKQMQISNDSRLVVIARNNDEPLFFKYSHK